MPQDLLPPVSFQLTQQQLDWLDARRGHGSISRSAALRQALDTLIRMDRSAAVAQPEPPNA